MSGPREPSPLRLLVLSGSARTQSLNTALARHAMQVITAAGQQAELLTMREAGCPGYDGDLEEVSGLPGPALALAERLRLCDGFVIAAPEYNASIPGTLKNTIDWVSRLRPQPWQGRHALLMSASPSMVGGNRGLWSLRVPLEHLGAHVYPEMFSLAAAAGKLGPGGLDDPVLAERFRGTVTDFLDLVEAARNYPCLRRGWIEFLGEHATG